MSVPTAKRYVDSKPGDILNPSLKRLKPSDKLNIDKGLSVLDTKVDSSEEYSYQPRSKTTSGVYKEILSIIQTLLVSESSETLVEAATEVISIFKADESDQSRRRRLGEFLPHSAITDELYSSLFRLCSLITDFMKVENERPASEIEGTGIAVTFDEDDEEKEEDYTAVLSDDEALPGTGEEDEEAETGKSNEIESGAVSTNPNEIPWSQFQDGLWLRRELMHLGISEAETLERGILNLLELANLSNNSLIENKLFQLFKFKNLALCKLIVYNRFKLWFAHSVGADPSSRDSLASQLLELTDPRASDFYRELTQDGGDDGLKRKDSNGGVFPQPSCLLDLSSLVFEQGGRLMSNPTFVPQTKTLQVSKKSYDEVHVQAAEKVQVKATDLISVKNTLPNWMHAAFSGFDRLNPIQSKVFPVAFHEFTENILMCAPTGAGKTNVAMLAVMNVLKQYWNEEKQNLNTWDFKIVYIAPMKALVQEVVKSFSLRLNPLGLNVRELSGDVSIARDLMAETHVIVTTPEKWDVITRKSGESSSTSKSSFTHLVRLLIIDEVHLLHDSRGPVIEALVARTIRQVEQTKEFVRIVALSATLPNFRDVALFLRVNLDKGLFYFGSEYRPVPLDQTYVGITSQKGLKRAQVTNEVLFEKVVEDAGKNQILVFVHGRKETVRTARELRSLAIDKNELSKFVPQDSGSKGILEHEATQRVSAELKDLLPFGIGVHHAGLSPSDRSTVEDLFAARHLSIVVCTLTLAWGVNLPAHTVIIKGTQIYVPEKGDWVELSPMDMMQMMGRAGRPQYDTSGHGIIITNKSELQYYLSLNNMQLPIESQLIGMLPDMLNAELALGTVCSRNDAAKWLGYTYLFVRMMQNPGLYSVPLEELNRDPKLVQRRVDLAHAALTQLDKNGLCKYDRRSGSALITALGKTASYFYLKAESVSVYNQHLKPSLSDMEILRLFSLSREFKFIPVREEEKIELMKLVELVPIPIKGGAEDSCSKINVLLQAYVSRLSLEGFALMADMVFVTQNAGRLFRALFEIALKRGWCVLARRCLAWCKIVELRMWPIQSVLRHFSVVPDEVCRKIERKGLSNEEFSLLNAEEIGQVIRNPKLGRQIHSLLSKSVPKLNLTAYVQPLTRSTLLIKVDLSPQYDFDAAFHKESEFFWLFVEDVSQQHCLYADQLSFSSFQVKTKAVQTITFTVPVTEPVPPFYFIRIVPDRWLIADTLRPISFRTLVLPEKNLPLTELQDSPPVAVSLQWPEGAEMLNKIGIEFLNPLQSQMLEPLWGSDNNAVLCAPLSSGRSVCLDFAIMRVFCGRKGKKVIFMTPNAAVANLKLQEFRRKFASQPDREIELLTGDPGQQDLKIFEASDLIVCTPFALDLISRKWRTKRTRKLFEATALFVSDNLHLLDTAEGAVQELVTSRMRYIAGAIEKENKLRLIGSASFVSNAHDLASWIGASPSSVFSFGSSVRSLPLEIVMHGFDIYNRSVRQSACMRPLYAHINKSAGASGSVLAFCTSRKQVRSAAADLTLLAVADGKPFRFLLSESEQAQNVRERSLASALAHGIGYVHAGMTEEDKSTVVSMFRNRFIQVLFVSWELMWGLGLKACLVAILDTTCSGEEQGGQLVDYRAVEVQEMLACAGRAGIDESGKCVLFCANSKREFYKRFIHEPLNVESLLDESLSDHLNAEIANGTIKSRQDCIDWLTWTLFYRRITKNPNYYSLSSTGHQAVSDYLSGLVEDHVDELIEAGMICSLSSPDEEEADSLSAGDLGLVASYYNVKTRTVEMFKRSISQSSKRKQLIEILCQACEFESIFFFQDDYGILSNIANSLKLPSIESSSGSAGKKVLVLLHAHFNRIQLSVDLQAELNAILPTAHRLVLAMVDVISTCGWLKVALAAMEIAPMLVQACVPSASPLIQLPHFDQDRCEEARGSFEVEDVVDILSMNEADRDQLLSGLSQAQVQDVARACNMYPSISLGWKRAGNDEGLEITLEREGEGIVQEAVFAPRFPRRKEEAWWLVLGSEEGEIEDLKRITISRSTETVSMRFSSAGNGSKCKLLLMSDSFIGCDQEETIDLTS